MRIIRSLPVVVMVVVVSALAGGLFGGLVLATQDRMVEQYKAFSNALAVIETNYVDEVDTDRLIYSAINGMLQTLDPHSRFMDPRTYSQMRERQEGRYYGLGITIQVINGDIKVIALFEGSPAYMKGIRRGDVIAEIEGESAKGWTSDQAVTSLRGPKGSMVNIGIRRLGYDALIPLAVMRDEINIQTILGAFMVSESTGYIRLRDFSETTDRDLGVALEELAIQGMQQLLLDLRDNPGGPLDQAIRVANRFLPRGDMIVYTRGRVQNSDQDYYAREDSDFADLTLIVLVNRNSASASEIVAGAIQDHDRGLIVGETTFGKALVQSIYPVSQGAGLALTTARYYTPSGRLIQRPWDGTFDEYLNYSLQDQERERDHSITDLKYTDSGRHVYSGGGIEPDRFLGRRLFTRQAFSDYAQRYSASGDTRITEQGQDRINVDRDFEITDEMLSDFTDFVAQKRIMIDDDELSKDEAFVRAMIRYYIDLDLFGVGDARRHLVEIDPQATFALSLFADAKALTQLSVAGQSIH